MLKKIKDFLKKHLKRTTRLKLRHIVDDIKTIGFGNNLDRLARIYRTDKVGKHSYTQHYRDHFRKYKYKKFSMLEIGVGGYEDPFEGAYSLRMWKRFFPRAKIFSIDIFDKSALNESRIRIFQGSQVDAEFLESALKQMGPLDIIIDDGSHRNEHVIESFHLLFPKLKDGGIYVVEDIQTSYWPSFGGDSDDLNNPKTSMNFFKGLTDCLNNKEFIRPGYQQTYYDKKIISMHFYHNLVFIYKGDNSEESNMIVNNT